MDLGHSVVGLDDDVWRAASDLMRIHGPSAAVQAGRRAEALLKESDLLGYRIWKRIAAAIVEFQQRGPGKGERLN